MVTQRTLRRKLQKKAKHKPYRKCPRCGERMLCQLVETDGLDRRLTVKATWKLYKICGNPVIEGQRRGGSINGCGYFAELFWSGGGTGRHIPHRATGQGKGQGCG